jgi:peptidoglycan/LPS O-acetylase OafA/YrhL
MISHVSTGHTSTDRVSVGCPATVPAHERRYRDYLTSPYRPAFDGLRGVGFLLVITAHIPSVPLFAALQGWAGVWVFFVISGYLLTMLMMREEKKTGGVAFGPFLIRRFFRIVPSYWAAILIYWLACLTLPALADEYAPFMARLPYYLTFNPEYAHTDVFTIFVHSWTVGIELKFYLVFPPVIFLALKDTNVRLAVTAIAAALLIAYGSFHAQSYCAILFGAMLAFVLERPHGYATMAALTRVSAAVPLGLVAILLFSLRYGEFLLPVAIVATYLVAHVTLQQGALFRLLQWEPLAYLGRRSYGAYLLHVLMIHVGYMMFGDDSVLGGVLTACVCLALTVPAAELLYRLVERPGIGLGRRMIDRMAAASP